MEPIKYKALTKYSEGTLAELWAIGLPLIFSFLSMSLMLFCDRLFLAHYSTGSLNAVMATTMICALFQYGALSISSIAEVFVGQYNGQGDHHLLGRPAWQMLWFALGTVLIFIPVALFCGPYWIPSNLQAEGLPYFKTLLLFGPCFAAIGALTSFFNGQGQVRLTFWVTVLANAINIFLDWVLIFGNFPGLAPMGSGGAALATGIAQAVWCLVLLAVFLKKSNRKEFGTRLWQLKPKLFWKCLCLGVPTACSHSIEIGAWAVLALMMNATSPVHLTVLAVGQSIFHFIAFIYEGLSKTVTTLAANFIGARKPHYVGKMLRSSIISLAILGAVLFVGVYWGSESIFKTFLPHKIDFASEKLIQDALFISLIFMCVYYLIDGFSWVTAAVLTAGGDTKFIFYVNGCNVWIFGILPVYWFIVHNQGSPKLIWPLSCCYAAMNALSFFLRYKSYKWRSIRVIESAQDYQ